MYYDVEYTISEVSELTGYAPHVLRYYEKEFEIEIPRTDSNHRYYTIKEIELIQYIKFLQEKGFSNKQIKLIIQSPEIAIANQNDNAIEVVHNELDVNNLDTSSIALEISRSLEELFFSRLNDILMKSNEDSIVIINELKDEVLALRQEINSRERDVIICENARLKMRLKEKTVEIMEIRERLKKFEEGQTGIFRRLFGMGTAK